MSLLYPTNMLLGEIYRARGQNKPLLDCLAGNSPANVLGCNAKWITAYTYVRRAHYT